MQTEGCLIYIFLSKCFRMASAEALAAVSHSLVPELSKEFLHSDTVRRNFVLSLSDQLPNTGSSQGIYLDGTSVFMV